MSTAVVERVERLSAASARRIIEPDQEVPGHVGAGQVIPDELLSVHGLGLSLTDEQRTRLSREEVASAFIAGTRLEAVLLAGFGMWIANRPELTDPRITYALHELGEETRHSRLFIRVLRDLAPEAKNPLLQGVSGAVFQRVYRSMLRFPALMFVLVLAGEEIPDLIARRTVEHPEADPFLQAVNRYHRLEEARHVSFARTVLAEVWEEASARDRLRVRFLAPFLIRSLFESLIHPGVYASAGLPGWRTWLRVNRSSGRIGLRHTATRPVVSALVDAGVLRAGRIPRRWRKLAGVDRAGSPVA